MSKAWIFQKPAQVATLGDKQAPFYVGWYEPSGKRKAKCCGAGFIGKKNAKRLKEQREAELLTGTYLAKEKKSWTEFRDRYTREILTGMAVRTSESVIDSLDTFERIVGPKLVSAITTSTIDGFIAKRRNEPGKKEGAKIAPASVNKDLRHVKAALAVAAEWNLIPALPKFRMEKEPGKLVRYVTGEHFTAMYQACPLAKMPDGIPTMTAADWWRGLLIFGYMTGWRIGDMLALRREDVNLDDGTALSLAKHNKGKRDELIKLHPVVVDHLRKMPGFDLRMFPWNYNLRTLYVQFARLQEAAGIHLSCQGDHEHTRYCHVYGFHDLRRSFATMNADKLGTLALQTLMRHKSLSTTMKYVNMAHQMDEAVASLHVPAIAKKGAV
jgi:integrase